MRKLVIIGASGFGREVAWIAARINGAAPRFEVLGFLDDAADKQAGAFGGYPLLGRVEQAAACGAELFFCAIGDNRARQAVTARAITAGLEPLTLIDPSAAVAPDAALGSGSYVGFGSVVSTGARLGAGVIVNHHVTVGHDAAVGDFAQLCPGVRVSGGCVLGAGALLGSNACVIPGVKVGAWATVGAGSAALRDVADGGALVRIR
jgi:sugar O-acyltransferase (sialic acid O-acetyltransferase NeuD family)